MKIINENIKNKEFKNVYLLYGEEEYLKKQYCERFRKSITDDDTINFSVFNGDKISASDIIDMGNTMPFFAEKRLIIVENSGFFKSSNEPLAEFIKNIPEYLVIVFSEKEIDKRNKVYKAVSDKGYVCEMNQQSTDVLLKWMAGILGGEGKRIERKAAELILAKSGADMNNIRTELEKLICYCMDKTSITEEDVEEICTTQTVSRIFDMITAIATKKQKAALDLYYDLLELKEPPMRILYLISRQFNGIFQVKEGQSKGFNNGQMAKEMGVAPFVVGKYATQAKYFSMKETRKAIEDCAKAEESVKMGKMNDKMSVELLIVDLSSK